ncbi:MAG: selenide, water dikinase SelD [Halobacteriales archaeon]|nr:selenide, water dikinase SelD [Halobacteriales archaeon]
MADEAAPALTEYAELHGCSCKVGQGDLEALLAEAGLDGDQPGLLFGVGEDAAARSLGDGRALVSTVDVFTPIIDDPADFGRVAAVNAASDAFATGAVDDLTCLAVLGLPRELTDVAADVLSGMVDALAEMDGVVAGGHTILNPWPLAGGAVTATAAEDDLLTTDGASPGDRLYLTKPLGSQPAMGALRVRDGEFAATVQEAVANDVAAIGREAFDWMVTPNRAAALAARPLASAATDVTGFGPLGEAATLAANSGVGVELTHLPVVEDTLALSTLFGYGLEVGESAETSGGLLAAVPEEQAGSLEAALDEAGVFHREVGRVTDGEGARLVDPSIEEIPIGTAESR